MTSCGAAPRTPTRSNRTIQVTIRAIHQQTTRMMLPLNSSSPCTANNLFTSYPLRLRLLLLCSLFLATRAFTHTHVHSYTHEGSDHSHHNTITLRKRMRSVIPSTTKNLTPPITAASSFHLSQYIISSLIKLLTFLLWFRPW